MRVLCDVHIAFKIKRFFESRGIEAFHVNDLPDSWFTKDKEIAGFADDNNLVVITKDVDFQSSHLLKNTPRQLLRLTLGNLSTRETIHLLEVYLPVLQEAFANTVCFVEIGRDYCHIVTVGGG
jgi:predicted nuclease of predicted toxin-antitoxin system